MIEKKKKIIIGASIAVILLLLVILIIAISNNDKETENTETLQTIELSEVINIEDIEKLSYETEKTDEEISSKYIVGRNKFEVKANVQLGETEGKLIYARGTQNLNIYKTEYTLSKYGDKNTQVNGIIQTFEETCKNYMGIDETYQETEQLYGESTESFARPIEESIYDEERLFSKTYKSEENTYDINFYRQDNQIVCEFVKVLS